MYPLRRDIAAIRWSLQPLRVFHSLESYPWVVRDREPNRQKLAIKTLGPEVEDPGPTESPRPEYNIDTLGNNYPTFLLGDPFTNDGLTKMIFERLRVFRERDVENSTRITPIPRTVKLGAVMNSETEKWDAAGLDCKQSCVLGLCGCPPPPPPPPTLRPSQWLPR